jgi:hypothetical protein
VHLLRDSVVCDRRALSDVKTGKVLSSWVERLTHLFCSKYGNFGSQQRIVKDVSKEGVERILKVTNTNNDTHLRQYICQLPCSDNDMWQMS